MNTDRIILGIDPGTNILGYGLIYNKNNKIELIRMDVIKLNKLNGQHLKLKAIFENTLEVIEKYKPDELAIESQFFGKNVQSMLKLGRAQGVAIAAALYKSIPVFEYSPRKIKQAITGKGNASKEQVAAMLSRIVKITETPDYYDATDALGVAVCHFFQKAPDGNEKKSYTGWKSFITNNPKRLL
ncbi:MAG: crossover junction endodeoxyribonuclease RuvC [Bacteroidales bacterium]|nr:crossover junction endodeoxyribonuclease RuvC [Bacteroidales bacterium]MDD4215083.1 crossover junction endodeoxyribonuclease RuvC [Bacteroidales bacterium]